MSFEAMAWAVKWDLPVKQKITLIMLADRVNKDTGRCFPSIKGLAEDCGMSETSVKEAIRSLREAGIIIAHERKIGTVNLSNEYELDTSKFPPPRRNTPHPPAQYAPPPRRNTPPNLLDEPVSEPESRDEGLFSQDEAPEVDHVAHQFAAFWKAYPNKTGKPAAEKNFRKAIKEGADPDRIIEGARRYAATDAVARGFAKHPQGWLTDQRWEDAALWVEQIDPARARLRAIVAEAQAAESNARRS